jgi:hypothetical protein
MRLGHLQSRWVIGSPRSGTGGSRSPQASAHFRMGLRSVATYRLPALVLLLSCLAAMADAAKAAPIILPVHHVVRSGGRASFYIVPPDGAHTCAARFTAGRRTSRTFPITLGGPSRKLSWKLARGSRGTFSVLVTCGSSARRSTSLGTARATFVVAGTSRRSPRLRLKDGSWHAAHGWIPSGPPQISTRARKSDFTEIDTSAARTCNSPFMSKAYAVGYGYGARIGFAPKAPAYDNVVDGQIWSALAACVSFPTLTTAENDSMFKQMVCHSIYAIAGGAGSSWDFEAWRSDPSWFTALDPHWKCQQWGDVPNQVAAAQFNGMIVQGSLDTSAQKAAYLIVETPFPDYISEHILTTKAYGCIKAEGAPGPVVLASDFLSDELVPGPPVGDEFCGVGSIGTGGGGGGTTGGGTSGGGSGPPSTASVALAQGPAAPSGYRYAVSLTGFRPNDPVTVTCYDSVSTSGFYTFTLTTDGSGAASTASYCYSGDGPDHWVVADGVTSNHVSWGGPPPPPPQTWSEQETPNHPVNTFTDYHNASGMGPAVAAGQWVQVSCKVYDPTIGSVNPDGYWYRIASSPWNNAYYSPANTFMNGDPYGGPYTHNTDFNVPNC